MDNALAKPAAAISENASVQMEKNSAKKFQNFIFELFEENGVLGDLRAHLRGQIVTVLRNASKGDPTPTQQHLTQRLEMRCQAINVLVADYLLSLDFKYTLSVFVSELPLTNMMHTFSEYLQKLNVSEDISLNDNDVQCLLKFLGINVDSENVCNILKMYKIEKKPLLECLFKIMCFYHQQSTEKGVSPKPSKSETIKSDSLENLNGEDDNDENKEPQVCRHLSVCESCLQTYAKMNDKYKQKLRTFADIFKQVRSVYEEEIESMKSQENHKIEQMIAVYAAQNQMRREEMEQSYREKQEALEASLSQKKKFLWEVAQSLRSQHEKMSVAMKHVRGEDKRLTHKKLSLRRILSEAEENIRQRGECIRAQISNELAAVNDQLESVRHEKQLLLQEKMALQSMRDKPQDDDDINSKYIRLEKELVALKEYLESKNGGPKHVADISTNTDLSNVNTLNNREVFVDEKRCVNPIQVVNDLKRDKNVNHDASNKDESGRPRVSTDLTTDTYNNLQPSLNDENNKILKETITQLQYQMQEVMSRNGKMQAELTAANQTINALRNPSRVPTTSSERVEPFYLTLQRETASKIISRSGGGEELLVFGKSQPLIVLPGDTLPFLGVVGETSGWNRANRRNRKVPTESQTKINETQPINAALSLQDEKPDIEENLQPAMLSTSTLPDLEPPCKSWPTDSELRLNSHDKRPVSTVNDISPDVQKISPNIRSHSPDKRTHSPDMRSKSPDMRQISPDIRPISPDIRPISPDIRPISPDIRPISPDIRPILPDMRPISPDLRQNSPHLFPSLPKARPNSPERRFTQFNTLRPEHSEHTATKQQPPILRSISSPERKNTTTNNQSSTGRRHRSPSTILREAKLRLRKLEIEAEAVEMSYIEYKKRQGREEKEKENETDATSNPSNKVMSVLHGDQDIAAVRLRKHSQKADYQVHTNTDYKHTVPDRPKLIPDSYTQLQNTRHELDYIKTPITDFRKLYAPSNTTKRSDKSPNSHTINIGDGNENTTNLELNILNNELRQMYDIEVAIASPSAISEYQHKLPEHDKSNIHDTCHKLSVIPLTPQPNTTQDQEIVVHKECVDRVLDYHNIESYRVQTELLTRRMTQSPRDPVPVRDKQELTNIIESPEGKGSPSPQSMWQEDDKDGMSECYRNPTGFSDISADNYSNEQWSTSSACQRLEPF